MPWRTLKKNDKRYLLPDWRSTSTLLLRMKLCCRNYPSLYYRCWMTVQFQSGASGRMSASSFGVTLTLPVVPSNLAVMSLTTTSRLLSQHPVEALHFLFSYNKTFSLGVHILLYWLMSNFHRSASCKPLLKKPFSDLFCHLATSWLQSEAVKLENASISVTHIRMCKQSFEWHHRRWWLPGMSFVLFCCIPMSFLQSLHSRMWRFLTTVQDDLQALCEGFGTFSRKRTADLRETLRRRRTVNRFVYCLIIPIPKELDCL